MSRGITKAERLRDLEWLYSQRAYTDRELAERLGVNRTTIFRDRLALESEIPFEQPEQGRWRIDRGRYLTALRVDLHEALALYLAARRAQRQTLVAQPHLGSALEKLATVLRQPMTDRLVRAAGALLEQRRQDAQLEILEQVTLAWARQVKIRLRYRSLRAEQAANHLVSPYLIEPATWNEGIYLIGHSDLHGELTTFRIERIEQAELTGERYTIPEGFDHQALFRHAWGIWFTDQQPVEVRLRFLPGEATRRVKEIVWHATQQIEDLPDGGCLWTAQVAEWREMAQWVRGWGAGVEVLAPEEMREALKEEARRLREVYEGKD